MFLLDRELPPPPEVLGYPLGIALVAFILVLFFMKKKLKGFICDSCEEEVEWIHLSCKCCYECCDCDLDDDSEDPEEEGELNQEYSSAA